LVPSQPQRGPPLWGTFRPSRRADSRHFCVPCVPTTGRILGQHGLYVRHLQGFRFFDTPVRDQEVGGSNPLAPTKRYSQSIFRGDSETLPLESHPRPCGGARGTLECCSIRSASGSEWVVIQSWVFFEARTIKCANASRMSGCRLASLRFVERQQRRRTGAEQRRTKAQEPQLPVRESPALARHGAVPEFAVSC
jgi:hypothetical protein